MNVALATSEIPTGRDELWRYTPVDEIRARIERSVNASHIGPVSVTRPLIDALTGTNRPRLVFVNGFHAADLSDLADLPAGVRCGISDPLHADDTDDADDPVVADVALVAIAEGVRLDAPIHVVHVAVPDPLTEHCVLSLPRTVIEVGEAAHLVVVETYCGLDGSMLPTLSNTSTTIRLGDRARLAHYRVQTESTTATHVGHTRIEQGADSVFQMTSVTLGGDIARNAVEVHLDAAGSRTELAGISMTSGSQRHDTVVTVDHAASQCSSSQRFAGVVDDHGRGSFNGEIIVRPGTTATDAHQSSRNIVLDANAEADARPWLRILADDVRCTHGATVGRLDDEALHYLRSRGIALPQARAMLIDAFVRDITDAIPHDSVRSHVAALVGAAAAAPIPVEPHR
ncbi:MAG: Fe-S cluster assembly protein SufD [Acidimicrobiaceae bacterium]|nr:Fe-S cluster assembly protein SufD [Acidimicrobiaceae bacterium]